MATLIVDTTADNVDLTDGRTSLREALVLAGRTAVADRITFDASVFGPAASEAARTIVLQAGQLKITGGGALTVDGDLDDNGVADVVIDGDDRSRVLETMSEDGVTLDGLVITGGQGFPSGGGIRNVGTLVMTSCTVTDNIGGLGGGMYSKGALYLTDCTVSENVSLSAFEYSAGYGGGLYCDGLLKMVDCTIINNKAFDHSYHADYNDGRGGGIYIGSDTTATLSSCTIAGNSATDGGGIVSGRDATLTLIDCTVADNNWGAGVEGGYKGALTLVNSTVSGNHAGGVRTGTMGTLTAVNSTIVANEGGGVLGDARIANSIVAGNAGGDVLGAVASNGANIFSGSVTGAAASDIIVALGDVLTTVLGGLADNGGPTLTHAPLAGSIAIDGGVTADALDLGGLPLLTDQRGDGFPRVVGTAVDIGAVERGAAAADDIATTTRGRPVTVDVLANDSVGGGALAAGPILTGQPAHGPVMLLADDTLAYLPEPGFLGSDSFIYEMIDDEGLTGTASVTVEVAEAAITIDGNDEDNVIAGGGRAELIDGRGGGDAITGNGGADTLLGGAGDDFLKGGAEDDVLIGGLGGDLLNGGSGADLFVLTDLGGIDQIGRLDPFEGDRLLIAIPELLLADGSLDGSLFRIEDAGGQKRIVVDLDGNGVFVRFAQINGGSGLDPDDFLLNAITIA